MINDDFRWFFFGFVTFKSSQVTPMSFTKTESWQHLVKHLKMENLKVTFLIRTYTYIYLKIIVAKKSFDLLPIIGNATTINF